MHLVNSLGTPDAQGRSPPPKSGISDGLHQCLPRRGAPSSQHSGNLVCPLTWNQRPAGPLRPLQSSTDMQAWRQKWYSCHLLDSECGRGHTWSVRSEVLRGGRGATQALPCTFIGQFVLRGSESWGCQRLGTSRDCVVPPGLSSFLSTSEASIKHKQACPVGPWLGRPFPQG